MIFALGELLGCKDGGIRRKTRISHIKLNYRMGKKLCYLVCLMVMEVIKCQSLLKRNLKIHLLPLKSSKISCTTKRLNSAI